MPRAACDGARRDRCRGPSGRQPSTPVTPKRQWRCRETPARTAATRGRGAMPQCPRSAPPRPLPRGLIVPRIVGRCEYSSQLVAAHAHATNHAAIAGVIGLLLGERSAKPGRWPVRRVVGFGSGRDMSHHSALVSIRVDSRPCNQAVGVWNWGLLCRTQSSARATVSG